MSKRTNANDRNPTSRSQNNGAIGELERLVLALHADGKCGRAATKYNLVKAGAIEVASEHVPGCLRDDDVFFEHSKWKLTELGRSASTNTLRSIILQIHPLRSHSGMRCSKLAMLAIIVGDVSPMIHCCWSIDAFSRIFSIELSAFVRRGTSNQKFKGLWGIEECVEKSGPQFSSGFVASPRRAMPKR
jgi:hypothetical protein